MIKTLKALQHLTLVPHFYFLEGGVVNGRVLREFALKSLKPLRDLRLKDRLELRISGSEEDIRAVDTTLESAGFDCYVTCLKE